MKKISWVAAIVFSFLSSSSQDLTKFKLYKPEENAKVEIASAVKKATATGKHILVQIGGNWCIWCARFNEFVANDERVEQIILSIRDGLMLIKKK